MRVEIRLFDFVWALLIVYLFVFQIATIWPFTIDDMYIPLRYAKHWVSGEGLLWNIGEPPVEGYTSFGFLVLAAAFLKMGLNPVIMFKVAGVLGLVLTAIGLTLMSRLWFNWRLSFIPLLWLLWYRGQIVWSVSGLETSVYEALMIWAVFFAFRALGYRFYPLERRDPRIIYYLLSGLMLAFAALTRPETPAFVLMFFFLFYIDGLKKYWRGLKFFTAIFLCFYLPYFLWHYYYFTRLFPNSIYCKGLTGHSWGVLTANYLKLTWPFLLLSLPAIQKAKDFRYLFLLLPSIIYMFLLLGADPIVAFYNRLFLPAFALLLPLSLLGLSHLMGNFFTEKNKLYQLLMYVVSLTFAIVFIPGMTLNNYQSFTENPIKGEQLRQELVDWLKNHVDTDKTIVLSDSGYIPFYSPHSFIDSYCLNNLRMTQYSGQMYQQFCKDIFQQKPEVIILTSLVEPDKITYTPADLCLHRQLKNTANYQKKKVFKTKTEAPYYRYELFKLSRNAE
ncbi:hypothetical protein [Legionella israelensis]|uniref:LphB n=1 Tax=Legionella israelensis TaxID=454 RepID=A0A0W0WMS3_9GAMM|nr:hypothetical protein [Legionella israelensis]KTD33626.1 LphB [Legionella israelensis]QBS08792.1 protein LphB [Legionella israelensis]SCY12460.1 hypothetical protein SAMN02746069_01368 [Legionella israelensis DSM 19235]STX58470.1 LphB [Legionella israelensis]